MRTVKKFIRYTFLSAGLGLMVSGMAACGDKRSDEEPAAVNIIEPGSCDKITPVMVTESAALLSTSGESASLMSRFSNIVPADAAKVIAVSGSDLTAHTAALVSAYRRGALIAVTDPDETELTRWCEENGVPYAGYADPAASRRYRVSCFNSAGAFYFLEKDVPANDCIDSGIASLNSFAAWVNLHAARRPSTIPDSPVINRRFTPQSVTLTFSVALDRGEVDAWNNTPMALSSTTAVDVTYSVYPIHIEGSDVRRYYIEAALTVNNPAIFNGYWATVRESSAQTVYNLYSAFYMRSVSVSSRLLKAQGNTRPELPAAPVFARGCSPVPATSDSVITRYRSGFADTFNATITGGFDSSAEAATGQWTWNNIRTIDCAPMSVSLVKGDDSGVNYLCTLADLPDDNSADIPEAATDTFTFRWSWAWEVKGSDNESHRYISVSAMPDYLALRRNHADELTVTEFSASADTPFIFRLIDAKK